MRQSAGALPTGQNGIGLTARPDPNSEKRQ